MLQGLYRHPSLHLSHVAVLSPDQAAWVGQAANLQELACLLRCSQAAVKASHTFMSACWSNGQLTLQHSPKLQVRAHSDAVKLHACALCAQHKHMALAGGQTNASQRQLGVHSSRRRRSGPQAAWAGAAACGPVLQADSACMHRSSDSLPCMQERHRLEGLLKATCLFGQGMLCIALRQQVISIPLSQL